MGIFSNCSTNVENKHIHNSKQSNDLSWQSYYACPQHPEIKQYNPGLCSICRSDMIKSGGLVLDKPVEKSNKDTVIWLVKGKRD
jgi:hypothetical protein